MHFDLHEDSPTSEYSRVEIYGMDYDKLLTLSGTRLVQVNQIISPADFTAYKIAWIQYSGSDLYTALSNKIPTDPNDGGCVFNRQNVFEDFGGGFYLPAGVELSPLGSTQPSDWGTNQHYFSLEQRTVTVDGTPATIMLPRWYRNIWFWDPNTQMYEDTSPKQKRLNRKFYFDNGAQVSVSSMCGYYYNDFQTFNMIGYWADTIGRQNGYDGAAPYGFTDAGGVWITSGAAVWDYISLSQFNNISDAAVYDNRVVIGIWFEVSGEEFVGFAVVHFSAGAPDRIDLAAISRAAVADNVKGTGEIGKGNWGPTSDTGGGDGDYDSSSDDRGDGSAADTTSTETAMNSAVSPVIAAGFRVHQLQTTSDAMGYFYGAIFKTGAGSYLERFYQSAYDPTSAIVALHLLPQNLVNLDSGTTSHVTAAGYDISQTMHTDSGGTLNVNFPDIVQPICGYYVGKVDFTKYFGAYPDFAPHTKMYLHLPYIGVQEIDVNQVQHGSLAVSYYCDAISGSVSAHVWCNDREGKHTYKYVCTGNAAYRLPIYSNGANSGAISAGIGAIASAFGGNIFGTISAGVAAGLGAMQQSVQATGSFGGELGALGDPVCWLEIVRPAWVQPSNYQLLNGLPSYVSGTISDPGDGNQLNGFTVIPYINLDNLTCTEEEIKEIAQLLAQGIDINGDL